MAEMAAVQASVVDGGGQADPTLSVVPDGGVIEPNSQVPKGEGEQPAFGDNWRQALAGEDDKAMSQLERFTTPKDLFKSYREAQDKIAKGQAKKLPEDPTDAERAAWREENGIPATADSYDLTLNDGLVVGEDDQPIINQMLQAMHGADVNNDQAKAVLSTYYQLEQAQISQQQEQDETDKNTAVQQLRDEWGQDFQGNKNALTSILNTVPESAREGFKAARLADGTALMNSPEVLMWLADVSRKTNPAATVVPNADNPGQAINDEIKSIVSKMGTAEYDSAMKERYRKLLMAQNPGMEEF